MGYPVYRFGGLWGTLTPTEVSGLMGVPSMCQALMGYIHPLRGLEGLIGNQPTGSYTPSPQVNSFSASQPCVWRG